MPPLLRVDASSRDVAHLGARAALAMLPEAARAKVTVEACAAGAAPSYGDARGGAAAAVALCSDAALMLTAAERDALLGGGAAERALLGEALELCAGALSSDPPRRAVDMAALRALDSQLADRSFFTRTSHPNLADALLLASVHGAVAALAPEDRANLCNLWRWAAHTAHAAGLAALLPPAALPGGLPRVPAAVPAPAAAPRAAAPKGGDKGKAAAGGGGKAAAAAAAAADPAAAGEAAAAKQMTNRKDKKAEKAAKKAAKAAKGGDAKGGDKPAKGGDMAKKEVDVSCLNIRVGKIVSVEKHPNADALYVEKIDLGEGEPRQVVSGLVKFKTEEQMLNARVLVLANVKPSKMREVASQGMVLCASNEDHTVVDFVSPPEGAPLGERVTVAGFDGEPDEVLVPKKKRFEKCAPDLRTDDKCVPAYKGAPLMTSAGPCTTSVPGAFIK